MIQVDQVPSQQEENLGTEQETVPESQEIKEYSSPAFNAFKEAFGALAHVEEKLKCSLEFMRDSLSQKGVPRFKDFWEAKKWCLPLFKEKINPNFKNESWTLYTELVQDAKRRKEMLEEQSKFSIEQIELALAGLRNDIEAEESMIDKSPQLVFLEGSAQLTDHISVYNKKQGRLSFYNVLATKLKQLREEVIRTEMRSRHKSRLLKDISSIGDCFIPQRKILMKEIGDLFLEDCQAFVQECFDLENKKLKVKDRTPHLLREEIKVFQDAAKKLTLSSFVFSSSREKLTECWEIVKTADKEKKKEFFDKKLAFEEESKKAASLIEQMVLSLNETPPASKGDLEEKRVSLFNQIDALNLPVFEKKNLKTKAREALEPLAKPFVQQELEHQEKQKLKEETRKQQIEDLKTAITKKLQQKATTFEDLESFYQEVKSKSESFKMTTVEQAYLEEMKKDLYEALLLAKEATLSEDDEEGWQALFDEWKQLKEILQAKVETYRKERGLSGFDFEKAMLFKELADGEKARLDRAVEKVSDLEDRF